MTANEHTAPDGLDEAGADDLIELGARLAGRLDESGPETLDRAITAYARARDALPEGDPRSGRVALRLGVLLTFRHLRHGTYADDPDRAIPLLEEVVADGTTGEGMIAAAHGLLGVLRLLRLLGVAGGPDVTPESFFLTPPRPVPITDEPSRRVISAARDDLDAATASDVLPVEIRSMMALGRLATELMTVTGDDAMTEVIREIVNRAMELVDPGRPGYAEVTAVGAWLTAMERTDDGEPAEVVVADLETVIDRLGEGHVLGPLLMGELAARIGERVFDGAQDGDIVTATRLLADSWRRIRPLSDHPMWAETLRRVAGISLTSAAYSSDTGQADRARELAELMLSKHDPDDRAGAAPDRFLHALARLLRTYQSGDDGGYVDGLQELADAARDLSPDDELRPTVLTALGAALSDDWLRRGGLESTEMSDVYLEFARHHLSSREDSGGRDLLVIRGLSGILRVLHGANGDRAQLASATADLEDAVENLPRRHLLWPRMANGLGVAYLMDALGDDGGAGPERRRERARAAVDLLRVAAETETFLAAGRPTMLAENGIGLLFQGLLEEDGAVFDEGIALMERAVREGSFLDGERTRLRQGVAGAHLLAYEHNRDPAHLDQAIAFFREAHASLDGGPVNTAYGRSLSKLAQAYWQRGRLTGDAADRAAATRDGLAALRSFEEDVLLQTGADHGLAMARNAAAFAREVTGWCLAGGDLESALVAIERGRGLLLSAATATADAPGILRAADRGELADEWQSSQGGLRMEAWTALGDDRQRDLLAQLVAGGVTPYVPGDLRYRVLKELGQAGRRLVPEPSPADLAAALRRIGADALVYLVPGATRVVDRVLVLRDDGALTGFEPPDAPDDRPAAYLGDPAPGTLPDVCDWAWTTVLRPLLAHLAGRPPSIEDREPRLVLVPLGTLGVIPWHAARDDTGERPRYVCEDAVFSYIASGRQLIEISRRTPRPPGGDPVLVANPTLDLFWADAEVTALRSVFYPYARVYGPLQEDALGDGRPDEILTHLPHHDLPGASLLHLACHAYTGTSPIESSLELASEREEGTLKLGRLLWQVVGRSPDEAGGMVVLSACESDLAVQDHDEGLTLATTLLAAGATTVVGTRWAIADMRTVGLMFMFHHYLADDLPPADALRAAQLWMLDPGRRYPETMPRSLREDLSDPEYPLDDPRVWAAFTHQGL